jgi:cytidyltransferase-like protein
MQNTRQVIVSGSFDDLRSNHLRFLEEAAKLGDLNVVLWSDEAVRTATGASPKFLLPERRYLLEAVRYVKNVHPTGDIADPDSLPSIPGLEHGIWVADETTHSPVKEAFCKRAGLDYHVVAKETLAGFPTPPPQPP